MLAASGRADAFLDRSEYAALHVVVGNDASPSERHAGDEFRHYWHAATGFAPAAGLGDADAPHVWIGLDAVPSELRADVPRDGLGNDGLHLKTLKWRGRYHLAIVGGQRGILYAVYEFFERTMGIRWLTPDVTHIPQAPGRIPRIDYRYVPPVFYRDISQRTFMTNPAFAVIHRMNGRFVNSQRIGGAGDVPEELGGSINYVNGFAGWGHTFFTFLHPDEYFDAHPEYFSEIHGVRQKEPTQLCLSNPEVARLVTEKAKAMLRAEPGARVVSVSQMDWEYYCTCASCRAVDAREGSPAGSLIHFVNQIAEGIAADFPEAFVDTYAYMYTQTPPKALRVRDNVIVRLCTFNNDFGERVTARRNERNRRFMHDLGGWTRIARNVFIYDYLPNFNAFQQPNPNLDTIQPNYESFVKRGVTGLYAQGNPESPASEFEHLRAYVASKAMWNPEVDAEAVRDEFISLYYGAAAPYIRDYLDLITRRAKESGQALTLFAPLDWMDYETVVRADELFRQAFMVAAEPEERRRLDEAYLPVRYAALVCKPRVTWTRGRVTLERPPSLTFDEYWATLQRHGVTHLNDDPIERLRDQMMSVTPPRRVEGNVHVLENSRYVVWVVPEFSGAAIRLRDTRERSEWLDAFRDVASGRDDFHDVILAGDGLVLGDEPKRVAYTVVESSGSVLQLEARVSDRLALTRSYTLDADGLHVSNRLGNGATEPVTVRFKMHPEFHIQGHGNPVPWLHDGTEWGRGDGVQTFADGDVRVGFWETANAGAWALGDDTGPGLHVSFNGPFTGLYFQSNRPRHRAAMDILSDEIILPAGQTLAWSATLTSPTARPIPTPPGASE